MEMFSVLMQKARLSLLSCLSALSIDVEVEHFRSLKDNGAQGAVEAECNVDGLQSAQCLACDLAHVMIL